MTFVWREALWLYLLIPVFVGTYVLLLPRRRNKALRYATLQLLRELLGAA